MRILITNDDGIQAPGLHVLEQVAREYGDTVVSAPDRNRSGVGQAITLLEPLRVRSEPKEHWYAVENGTPTDCVYVGIHHLMGGQMPDLILSGINPGPNLGWDVFYSGTVAGAREAVLQGTTGVAFSMVSGSSYPFESIVPWLQRVMERVIQHRDATPRCINVNFPNPTESAIHGIRTATVGQRIYDKEVTVRTDPRGGDYMWIGGSAVHMPDFAGSDCNAVRDGFVAVTPLSVDPTCRESLDSYRSWNFDERKTQS